MTVTRAQPAWRKPKPELVERFNAALPVHPDLRPRQMFGYPASFVNGYFFVGLHNDDVIVRLPGELKERFPELAGAAHFDPMGTGKGMKEWWLIPSSITSDENALKAFFEATFAEVQQLPPKPSKPKSSARRSRKKAT